MDDCRSNGPKGRCFATALIDVARHVQRRCRGFQIERQTFSLKRRRPELSPLTKAGVGPSLASYSPDVCERDSFRGFAENLPHLAWMARGADGIQWFNRRWFDYTGATLEACRGWGWLQLAHPDHTARVVPKWQSSLAAEESWEDTFPLRGADGTYRWFISRAAPHRDDQGAVIWYGTSTDIDHQIRVEDDLRQAARRRDALLAWLGHELRNPLTPIMTSAYLLPLLEPGDVRLHTAKETIIRQSLQLSNLVDHLLDAGRISFGKLRLRKARVELAPLIAQAVEACQREIERRRHRLTVSIPASPIVLEADATRVVQLVSNLLNNAAKYMHDGGSICVAIDTDDGAAVVRVRDEGIGISADVLSRVFDPYVQVGVGPLHAQGLGIGLALVKAITDAHGGSVEARSDGRDQGSEFIVRLPLADALSS